MKLRFLHVLACKKTLIQLNVIARQSFSHKINWYQNNGDILNPVQRNSRKKHTWRIPQANSKRVIVSCVWIKEISRNPGSDHRTSTAGKEKKLLRKTRGHPSVDGQLQRRRRDTAGKDEEQTHTSDIQIHQCWCKDGHYLTASTDWKNTEKCLNTR